MPEMIGTSRGAVLDGVEATPVAVEADVSPGLPQFSIVGLPDSAVSESKLRIRSAIRNTGLQFPLQRITVNLSPASMRKRGAGLDLAIAIAILRASHQIPPAPERDWAYAAELSLGGNLVPVTGILSLALAVHKSGAEAVMVAASQADQCVPLPGLDWIPFGSLGQVVTALRCPEATPSPLPPRSLSFAASHTYGDFVELEGVEEAKRALTIAAAGGHHGLLVGPPGSGKTMMAERLPTILPPLTPLEALDVYALQQALGKHPLPSLLPPLRAPHHTITTAGLIGGGPAATPGEVTLAHRGVLLLDEMLEFERNALESLREPLSTGVIRLARGGHSAVYPAKFQLLGTLNPCPCGLRGYGDCRCTDQAVQRYWSRLSGPLLDRMDIIVQVQPRPTTSSFTSRNSSSEQLRKQVEKARGTRQSTVPQGTEEFNLSTIKHAMSEQASSLLIRAEQHLALSRRGVMSVARVARTIAALAGSTAIGVGHVEEALSLRSHIAGKFA